MYRGAQNNNNTLQSIKGIFLESILTWYDSQIKRAMKFSTCIESNLDCHYGK